VSSGLSVRMKRVLAAVTAGETWEERQFRRVPGTCSRPGACTCHHVSFDSIRQGEHCPECGCLLKLRPTPTEQLAAVKLPVCTCSCHFAHFRGVKDGECCPGCGCLLQLYVKPSPTEQLAAVEFT
jgi:hypothetical protein